MANSCYPDILSWVQNLPPTNQWRSNPLTFSILSPSPSQPSLNLSVSKNPNSSKITFSIVADFNVGVALWTSKPIKTKSDPLDHVGNETTTSCLLMNFVEDVLNYASNKSSHTLRVTVMTERNVDNFRDIFNLSFLSLAFLVCIYEAPASIRPGCLAALKNHLTDSRLRGASKSLMKILGSNIEGQWMRSMNLAITNWIVELQSTRTTPMRTPSPLFSYSLSTFGLWKVQLYCPVVAMDLESSESGSADEKLDFSLKYHQLESVIQFNYSVTVQEKWVDVVFNIDNVRCDIIRLLNEALMKERGAGSAEKHFPSRISLHLTPIPQANIISISVGKSSENPTREIGLEKGIETSFQPVNPFVGIQISAGESMSMSLKPWKFEESVRGYSSILNWFLHDGVDGREVVSSKPSKISLLNPKAWFKGRYSSAYRPFTRQGGVIFAGDEYGNSVTWKVDKAAIRKTLEWEIRGWIWLTYWPNKHRTFYTETRRLEFRETVSLTIA